MALRNGPGGAGRGASAVLDFRYDTFLDLCETRNYSRTAENLGLSQPTVKSLHWLFRPKP